MKKYLVLLLAVLMLCITGCSQKEEEEVEQQVGTEETTQIANPFVEVTKEDFDAFGMAMEVPEKAENVIYYIVGEDFAQINFTIGEAEYTFRGKKDTNYEELCGIYGDLLASNRLSDAQYFMYADELGNTYLATWDVENITYVMMTDSSEELLAEVVEAYLK